MKKVFVIFDFHFDIDMLAHIPLLLSRSILLIPICKMFLPINLLYFNVFIRKSTDIKE